MQMTDECLFSPNLLQNSFAYEVAIDKTELFFSMILDLDNKSRDAILTSLQSSTDFVGVDILDEAKWCAEDSLMQPWTLYLKYDVKLFLE